MRPRHLGVRLSPFGERVSIPLSQKKKELQFGRRSTVRSYMALREDEVMGTSDLFSFREEFLRCKVFLTFCR